jgi:hypothetical protein
MPFYIAASDGQSGSYELRKPHMNTLGNYFRTQTALHGRMWP